MLGLVLYCVLVAAWVRRIDAPEPAIRWARATTIALGAPMMVSWLLSSFGVSVTSPVRIGVYAVVLCAALVPVSARRATRGPIAVPIFLAGALALFAFAAIRIDTSMLFIDPLAHLGWSRDLVDARNWYPVGFPGLIASLTFDDPLATALRTLPWILHVGIALQFMALGAAAGSPHSGVVGALAYLGAPNNVNRLEPPVPEALAALFIVATWSEILLARHRRGAFHPGIFLLVLATFVAHVAALEAVHLVALIVASTLIGRESIAPRLGRAILPIGAALLAVASSPFIMATFGDDPPLLLREQPGEVHGVYVAHLAWSWGYGLALVLAGLVPVWLLKRRQVDRSVSVLAGVFLACAALFVAPAVMATLGQQLGLQLFNSRLYGWASVFVSMLAVVLLAGLAPRHRWLLAGAALLVALPELLLEPLDPLRTTVGAIALLLIVFTITAEERLAPTRAWVWVATAVVLVAGPTLRATTWWPRDPAWLEAMTSAHPTPDLAVSNWPALNWIDARTDIPIRDGLGGRDANLALHRLARLPELRERLDWCAEEEATEVLRQWIDEQSADVIDFVVHPEFERAWSRYARARRSAATERRANSYELLKAPPCDLDPEVRLRRIRSTLDGIEGVRRTVDTDGVTVHRWIRQDASPAGR